MIRSHAAAAVTSNEADQPSSLSVRFGADKPLMLDCGASLSPSPSPTRPMARWTRSGATPC